MKASPYTVSRFYALTKKRFAMIINCNSNVISCLTLLLLSTSAQAASLEQAKQLHDRLAGVPASQTTLTTMAGLIDDGKSLEAAYVAMESPAFYSTTLKLFATPWTNTDQDIFEPLNDYSATVIGAIRDDVDFRQILQSDMLYVGKQSLNLPAYNRNDNAHYQALEAGFVDLRGKIKIGHC